MSSLSKIELLQLFHKNLQEFLGAMIDQLPDEGELIMLRVFLRDTIPIERAVNLFCARILPFSSQIINKDERFILNNRDIFAGIQNDKVDYFKRLWYSPNFTEEDKETIWTWFLHFLKLAKKYEPYLDPTA